MDFIEIVKYLHQDEFIKNPPDFIQKLVTIERLDSLSKFKDFLLEDDFNKTLMLSYVLVGFNWIMKSVIAGDPDLYNLTNLQFKVAAIRGLFSDNISNHYIDMIHAFLSSVALYYCDKSNVSLAEFNVTMGTILTRSANFWIHDFKDEYMKSRAPEKFLEKGCKEDCSCGSDSHCDC